MASKMLAIELLVVRQFNLEIFCLNVYGDNDDTRILYQWNELQVYIFTRKRNKSFVFHMREIKLFYKNQ